MRIAVCWRWVALGRPRSDESGEPDARWAGVSPADEAALEVALGVADRVDATVTVVSLGPDGAEGPLRAALAAGADRAVRIGASTALDADLAAEAVAAVVAGSDLVWCGDYSLDRGTGSFPAFLAARLGAAQALGLVEVDTSSAVVGGPVRAVRRLDGGRREVLDVPAPGVLSVEGSVAALRRATLASTLAAGTRPIDVVAGPPSAAEADGEVVPYRPRARVLPPPAGGTLDRVRSILDVGTGPAAHAETITLEPADAAARIVEQLTAWGYLEPEG